jgi:intracellular multiplication protein IcmE
MSGALRNFGSPKFPGFHSGRLFNASGSAGPRRLVILAAAALAVLALVVVVAMTGRHAPANSHDARMKHVDPLPGGLNSTPEQDALARTADNAGAQSSLDKGISFTPPMAPSVPVLPPPSRVEKAAPTPETNRHQPAFAGRPVPVPKPAPLPIAFPAAMPPDPLTADHPQPEAHPIRLAAAGDPKAEEVYSKQIGDLFSQWGGRTPRTDVVLPPSEEDGAGTSGDAGEGRAPAGATSRKAHTPVPAASHAADMAEILVPAGRGVYAHPILAVNSDASSPAVMQADTGPIAGDRMIGTFAKQADRLIIRINTVIHQGQSIGTDGVVVAPETMEAGVASDVDQHYLARFILPAAAAFVQGLGQAIATTSNTAAVLSPFGGAAYTTHLKLNQQLGVAAGAAAGQVGAALNQAAPKGPTVSLDANVSVGVMFLSNVTLHRGS